MNQESVQGNLFPGADSRYGPFSEWEYFLDLTPLPLDRHLSNYCVQYRSADADLRLRLRSFLTPDDSYTLLKFSGRCSAFAMLDSDPGQLSNACTAIASINPSGIDPRDLSSAFEQIWYVGSQLNVNICNYLRKGVEVADASIASVLAMFLASPARDATLDSYCLSSILTRRGRILVRRGLHRGIATLPLEIAAVEIAEMISADMYSPTIELGAALPRVWLSAIDDNSLDTALRLTVAGVQVKGVPRKPQADSFPFAYFAHLFVIWILEMSTISAAEMLDTIAARKSVARNDIAFLSLNSGRLFALLIARSTVVNRPSLETSASVSRFAAGLTKVLDLTRC